MEKSLDLQTSALKLEPPRHLSSVCELYLTGYVSIFFAKEK